MLVDMYSFSCQICMCLKMGVPHYPITIFLMNIGNFVGNVHIFWLNQILYHVDYIPHPIVYVYIYIHTHKVGQIPSINQTTPYYPISPSSMGLIFILAGQSPSHFNICQILEVNKQPPQPISITIRCSRVYSIFWLANPIPMIPGYITKLSI